jgi:phosphoenolpyruvate-protein phosphotransferase (PTS system enzyme I)
MSELPAEALRGIPGSPGVAVGRVLVVGSRRHGFVRRIVAEPLRDAEFQRFHRAVERVQSELKEIESDSDSADAVTTVLEAYALMVKDPTLSHEVERLVRAEGRSAEWAVTLAIDGIARRLRSAKDAYLRERSRDIEFVGEHLLRGFAGEVESAEPAIQGPVVLVARDLSPVDTAALASEPVVAFATERGSRTSHTAITARALKVPAVVGVSELLENVSTGDLVIVDGFKGTVIIDPSSSQIDDAERRIERVRTLAVELRGTRDQEAVTRDGAVVTLRANVEHPEEAEHAKEAGAHGVGLYRTEYLYIDRQAPPSEEEQAAAFRKVIEAMPGEPITLRTFDIGGDKFASTFVLPDELNPMLGLRAVRLALSRPEIFREHLRAMVRASSSGDVRIMVPMIAGLPEFRAVRAMLDQAIEDVMSSGHPCKEAIPLGVMIELPSAAMLADHIAREASFMSIGTNDLIQYTLAVDRASRNLAYLASPFDPSIARLIDRVVRAGAEFETPVSVCGAMAADPLAAVLLVGLGVRELSMDPGSVPETREVVRRISIEEASEVARRALDLCTAEEVEHAFAEVFAPRLYDLLGDDE